MKTDYTKFSQRQDPESQLRQQTEAERQQLVLELGDSHDSLGALAVALHERDQEQEAQQAEWRTVSSNELRHDFMNQWLSEYAPRASQKLAETINLPSDHKLITDVKWHLKDEEWETATFIEEPKGMIECTGKKKTCLWTNIEGMPLSVWFIPSSSSEEDTVVVTAHRLSGGSTGIGNIERLGEAITAYKNDVKKQAAQNNP